jgi:hypothetical protein
MRDFHLSETDLWNSVLKYVLTDFEFEVLNTPMLKQKVKSLFLSTTP